MLIKKFDIWLADLNPQRGTEPGKIRPVVVIQTDLLNGVHPSTLVCPVTSNVQKSAVLLRVHLSANDTGLKKDSDIMVDQVRSLDNRRFQKKIGSLRAVQRESLLSNLKLLILE